MSMPNDTLGVPRPDVAPYSFSRPFWDATREKKVVIQYCRGSGRYQFYPRPTSIYNGTRDLEWREVSGRGTIFSYTLVQRAPETFRGHEPYILGAVTLDVGVNVMADIVHCDLDRIRVGLPVVPFWAPLPNGTNLLLFQPESAA